MSSLPHPNPLRGRRNRRKYSYEQQESFSSETRQSNARPNTFRDSTSDLEGIEKGSNYGVTENASVFDVMFPRSPSEVFNVDDMDNDFESSSDDSSTVAKTSLADEGGALPQSMKDRMAGLDVDKYMASREMTPFQERLNALTMIPGPSFCLYILLSGTWLTMSFVDETMQEMTPADALLAQPYCISSSWLPNLHAMPPLPIIAGAFGIIAHAPFSFIYHWTYAHRLPPGLARTTHWSRRCDQAMIHFASATMSYAASGRWEFFLFNLLYNVDCMFRLFQRRVRPRRNQARIFMSGVFYLLPILRRGEFGLFFEVCFLLCLGSYIFSQYPLGGWSHSVFHLVLAFLPPPLIYAAANLPASQEQLKIAAQCAVLANQGLGALHA